MLQNDVGSCAWLVEEIAAARLVDRDRLTPFLDDFTAESPYADADAFAKHLAREGVLTRFQARRALDGEAKKLVLGAYVLTDIVGNGSLGPVYEAQGRADLKKYAIKVLPQRAWNVRLARAQVRAFAELAPHEGVVTFIDVGTAHQSHYLVWPFVEGRTLENQVRENGPMPPGETARMGIQIAEALRHCHARRLIHGMVKPSNVTIATGGQARLLDYGIGALLAENANEDDLMDTVSRAESLARMLECGAPESIADSSKWTAAGDQYGLGCTLYFAAAGCLPFPGGTFVDKIINHQMRRPTPLRSLNPDLPVGLADVLERLMQKLPGDRYRHFGELIDELAPLATVSCLWPPVPVDLETPKPKNRLILGKPTERDLCEPPAIELPEGQSKSGFWSRLTGRDKAEDVLHATIVAAGPARPGTTVTLHVYLHGSADADRLANAARAMPERLRILATGTMNRSIAVGTRIDLNLGVVEATVAAPTRETERSNAAALHRFTLTLPNGLQLEPLNGQLMVGQGGKLIAAIDFVLPVAGRK